MWRAFYRRFDVKMLANQASFFDSTYIKLQDSQLENETHAFIIRVWYEAQDNEGKVMTWRGSIDHVGGNKRLYFQDLNGAVHFIQEQSGIDNKQNYINMRTFVLWIQNEINKLQHKLRI